MENNYKTELKKYLNSHGLRFNLNEKRIWKFVEEVFGEKKAIKLSDIMDERYKKSETPYSHRSGNYNTDGLYKFCNNFEEATTLMHFQSDWFLKNSEVILEEIIKIKPKKLLELGCYTGIFSNYIAEQFSEMMVTGIDRENNLIQYGKTKFNSNNLKLLNLDYKDLKNLDMKFDFIFTNFGIENIPNISSNTYQIRKNEDYKNKINFFCEFFDNLNKVSEENAIFSCVIRIHNLSVLLPFIDASQLNGWKWLYNRMDIITENSEIIPHLVFKKNQSDKINLDKFLDIVKSYRKEDELFYIRNYEINKKNLTKIANSKLFFEKTKDTLYYEINSINNKYNLFMWSTLGFARYKDFQSLEDLESYFFEETGFNLHQYRNE